MLNNCREFLISVRSTLAINRRSKRRRKSRDKLHQINRKKLDRLRLKLKWLEDSPRQAFEGTAIMTPITATSRPFVAATGQGLPLHNSHILASSEIYHCTTCMYAAVRTRADETRAMLRLMKC
jgi:hypothetical protein